METDLTADGGAGAPHAHLLAQTAEALWSLRVELAHAARELTGEDYESARLAADLVAEACDAAGEAASGERDHYDVASAIDEVDLETLAWFALDGDLQSIYHRVMSLESPDDEARYLAPGDRACLDCGDPIDEHTGPCAVCVYCARPEHEQGSRRCEGCAESDRRAAELDREFDEHAAAVWGGS